MSPFIWSLSMIPVDGTMRREPKYRLIVEVREKAMPEASAVTIWEVPPLSIHLATSCK